jgi:hypothetical protein
MELHVCRQNMVDRDRCSVGYAVEFLTDEHTFMKLIYTPTTHRSGGCIRVRTAFNVKFIGTAKSNRFLPDTLPFGVALDG